MRGRILGLNVGGAPERRREAWELSCSVDTDVRRSAGGAAPRDHAATRSMRGGMISKNKWTFAAYAGAALPSL